MSSNSRRRVIGALVTAGTLLGVVHVGGLADTPVRAQTVEPDVALYEQGPIPFSTDDVIGSSAPFNGAPGNREAQDPTIILGNDPGEDTSGNIVSSNGNTLSPIDNSFTTDELDFFGATDRDRDGVYEEGYAGNIVEESEVVGLEVSDVATDLFKAGAPLGTWAAGLGGESIKASTEHFTVMESILTCNQTYDYDFWKTREDWDNGEPPVPQATAAALDAKGLSCPELTWPDSLDTPLADLMPNEDSVISDIAVDPDNGYSVTKKDDGKLLFRWGTSVKKPTDIRFQKTIPLPETWTDEDVAGTKGYRVTRAELVLNHNITNNPNDQIRPEDWENEAATGRLPSYATDAGGNWISTKECYEGDGDFIPAGTKFKDANPADASIPASDLQQGFTPAWYTTIERDPFEWSFRNMTTGALVGAHTPDDIAALQGDADYELVSGPRWRMTSNKFGQDLPGLEIPIEECTQPPYQKGQIRYETGEFTTTTVNLLDWSPAGDRWADDPAYSPFAYSAGWITEWDDPTTAIPGQVIEAEDALRCADVDDDGNCITDLGTTLTDGFDVSFYIKGDVKPAQVFDVSLVLEYETTPVEAPVLDYGDAPDPTYATLLASDGARSLVTDTSPTLGTLVDGEADGQPTSGADGDDLADLADEDGVSFGTIQAAATGTATVTIGRPGNVNGWIDFDASGTFDVDEQVASDVTASGTVTFAVPADATVGTTFARFRITDTAGASPTGYVGLGEVEDYSVEIAPPPDADAPFITINPVRVLDTRISGERLGEWSGSGPLLAGTTAEIPVSSAAGIPADATTAVVNLTATEAVADGFLTVYPCEGSVPTTSNLNYLASASRAVTAFAPISSTGTICVYTHSTTEVIVDVYGYTSATGSYQPITPTRITDTRPGAPLTAGSTLTITPPASTADALAVSVVAVDATGPGFLTVFPCSQTRPNTSTVNYVAGDPSANLAIVPNEAICVYTMTTTDVVVDVHGEFTEPVVGLQARLLDTRPSATPAAGATTVIDPSKYPSLTGRSTVALNLTATGSTVDGFLTVWPCSTTKPTASILNYSAGQTVANLAVVDSTSSICIYNHTRTDIVVDLVTGLS